MQFRKLTFGAADPEGRTVPVVVSTEEPVDRGNYLEILDHTPSGVDLSRAPLPLIESHNMDKLNIGLIEDLKLSNGKLRGVARFGTSQRAEEIFQDVLAGIIRSVSVGYQLLDNGTPTKDANTRRFRWMPYEASAVSVPADPQAGFFRTFKEPEMDNMNTEQQMTRSQRIASKNSGEAERERIMEIGALGKNFNDFDGVEALADAAIREGASVAAFTRALHGKIEERGRNAWKPEIGVVGLNTREAKRYSLCRAIEAAHTGDWRAAGFEREIHDEMASKIQHRSVSGLLVPMNDLLKRDMLTSVASNGGNLVGTELRSDLYADALREKSVILGLGATFLDDLVGNVAIPVLAGDVSADWMTTETSLIAESQASIGQVTLTPKSCSAFTQPSRRLLKQSTPMAEQIIINSMIETIGRAIDKAALQGSGVNGQPKGLVNWSGVGAVDGTTLSWASLLEFEEDTSTSFVDLTGKNCGWVTTAAIRKLMKSRVKVAGFPEYLWQSPDNSVNGYKAMATTNCPTGHLFFGDWSEIVVGNWGTLEILVDPYTSAQNALVSVRAIADVDIGIKHAGAFSIAVAVT